MTPSHARQQFDVLVIGGGLIGAVAAFCLHQCGLRVRVLDAQLEGAAWRAGAGLLTPSAEGLQGTPLWTQAEASLRLWPSLVAQLGGRQRLGYCEGLLHWQAQTASWQHAHNEAQVHPPSVVAAALRHIEVCHEHATSLVSRPHGVLVQTDQNHHTATYAILAVGVWSAAFDLPVQAVLGKALLLSHTTEAWQPARHATNSRYALYRPDGVYVGATAQAPSLPLICPKPASVEDLQDRQHLRGIEQELLGGTRPLQQLLWGWRLVTTTGLPLLAPHPQHARVLVATGHGRHGALLAPYTARKIVQWVQSA